MSKDVHIEKTIESLRQREGQLATELLEARNCIAMLERVFGDRPDEAETKGLVPTEPEPARTKSKKKTSKKKAKAVHVAGLRGPRGQFSKYKGVTRAKPKKDGTIMYKANVWDGKRKKNLLLGIFNNELLAAAAVQDYKGNKDEARKLRALGRPQEDGKSLDAANMKEQADNNPDRPTHQAKKKKGVTVYVCKQCGLEYQSKGKCAGCGNYDMREVKKEVG